MILYDIRANVMSLNFVFVIYLLFQLNILCFDTENLGVVIHSSIQRTIVYGKLTIQKGKAYNSEKESEKETNFTLSTHGANLLSVLPPRRITGARVEPFISGVTAVEGNKILIKFIIFLLV
jgi:hypothetical protein